MKIAVTLGLCAVLLAGCSRVSESRLNPLNWFRSEPEAPAQLVPNRARATDPRPLVPQITGLRLDPAPGGAILVARGLAARQGAHDAALVFVATQNPALIGFEFRAEAPEPGTPIGAPATRNITAARFLSDADLAGIRQIQVLAADGGRALRR
ncbi:MAG: hypothetical protein KJN93_07165 [Alphaproteobacteria bacterium]|nr:hypothetical protein [Alphaproteobacteria bacterium]NNF23446.1 hypothetical protein [Paracoccaceae bacterium]